MCFILGFSATKYKLSLTYFYPQNLKHKRVLIYLDWHLISVLIWDPNKWDSLRSLCAALDPCINATLFSSSDETEHSGGLNERVRDGDGEVGQMQVVLLSDWCLNCRNRSNNVASWLHTVGNNRRSVCVRARMPCRARVCIFAGLHIAYI